MPQIEIEVKNVGLFDVNKAAQETRAAAIQQLGTGKIDLLGTRTMHPGGGAQTVSVTAIWKTKQ